MKKLFIITLSLFLAHSMFAEEKKERKGNKGGDRKAAMEKRMQNMSDEEKAAFKEKMKQRRAEMQEKMKGMSDRCQQHPVQEHWFLCVGQ